MHSTDCRLIDGKRRPVGYCCHNYCVTIVVIVMNVRARDVVKFVGGSTSVRTDWGVLPPSIRDATRTSQLGDHPGLGVQLGGDHFENVTGALLPGHVVVVVEDLGQTAMYRLSEGLEIISLDTCTALVLVSQMVECLV
jgi:hypothetical protein